MIQRGKSTTADSVAVGDDAGGDGGIEWGMVVCSGGWLYTEGDGGMPRGMQVRSGGWRHAVSHRGCPVGYGVIPWGMMVRNRG